MDFADEFDFTVVADNIFPRDDTDVNFLFDVTWKDKSSKLIINCQETSRRNNLKHNFAKIKSFTIAELEAAHNELVSIEPRIEPYFPNEFTIKVIEIERERTKSAWNFFGFSSTCVVDQEREFSDETVAALKCYFRAVAEICGCKLMFSVLFNEESIVYYEEQDAFIRNESIKKIEQCERLCDQLLDRHNDIENLQSLECLYVQQDEALHSYQDALYNDSLMRSLPLKEEIELVKEELETTLLNLQVADVEAKEIGELRKDAVTFIQKYYGMFRQILDIKIRVSKKMKKMIFKYLTKMMEDKQKYPAIIFRDCAGTRMRQLALDFHKENEKIAQFNLDLHSAKDIVVTRKLELIHSWSAGHQMVRVSVRHEDVSLIQLKHLDSSNIDTSLLDMYYQYIKETYKLLLEYSESQRLCLENRKSTIDDPLNVIIPLSRHEKDRYTTKAGEKNLSQSIDYSGVIDQDVSDSEFEDALDEDQFGNIEKTETKKLQFKADCDNKLKEIANKRAELRNSKVKLETQYEKLTSKSMETTTANLESLHLESLHPEKLKSKKPVPGTVLTPEQRKEESKKVRERIRKYQEKLRSIPEEAGVDRPRRKKTGRPPKVLPQPATNEICSPNGTTTVNLPPAPPPPPGPPPPSAPPPPPTAPPTIVPSPKCSPQTPTNKNKEGTQQADVHYLDELQAVFAKKVNHKTSSTIDEELLLKKSQGGSTFNNTLSSMIDKRRIFYRTMSTNNSDDDTN